MKTAVVTGGSRGIGAAVARALAAAGVRVVVAARTPPPGGLACDVTDPASVRRLAGTPADILVNNAGIAASAPLRSQTLEDWNRVMAVNATGTFLVTQALLPGMLERKWGRVVNIASIAGLTGAAYISAYAASKHAVVGFTRAVAAEVAGTGVTVNAVCPGYVDTDMTRESVARIAAKTGRSKEEALQSILAMTPLKRLIEPEEVAHAVLSLCDENARGINGQAIVIG